MGFFTSIFQQQVNTIFIHTDKQQYYSGERVTGTVTLSVREAMHVDGIYLKVKGYQYTRFDKSVPREVYDPNAPNKRRTVYEHQSFSERDVFFRRRFCLYAVKSTLTPANFVFPFDFVLDTGLPGAFSFGSESGRTCARVIYKVKAEVAVPGIFQANLKHSQPLLIHEPLRQQLSRTDSFKEESIFFCCCISKGHVSMAASIDKNAYAPGETCNLKLQVDARECQVDIDNISFRLVRSLRFRAQGREWSDGDTLMRNTTPSVKAGGMTERSIPLRLPLECAPSCRSALISCEYTLQVVLVVPWCPDVYLTVPVQIYTPQLASYETKLVYPEGWAFTTMPTAHLQLSNGATY